MRNLLLIEPENLINPIKNDDILMRFTSVDLEQITSDIVTFIHELSWISVLKTDDLIKLNGQVYTVLGFSRAGNMIKASARKKEG